MHAVKAWWCLKQGPDTVCLCMFTITTTTTTTAMNGFHQHHRCAYERALLHPPGGVCGQKPSPGSQQRHGHTPPQCTSQHTLNIMQYNAPAVQYIDDGAALSTYWKLSLAWSQHERLKLIANQSGPGNMLREQGTIIGCCQL